VGANRQYPRYAIKAEIEVLDPVSMKGTARNMSRGGLCADFAQEIVAGTNVELRLWLVFDTDSFSEPLDVPARVVWCTGMGRRFQIGAQWRVLNSEQLSYLEMFLRFLEEGEHARGKRSRRPSEDESPFG
jgi:hypothetical protein